MTTTLSGLQAWLGQAESPTLSVSEVDVPRYIYDVALTVLSQHGEPPATDILSPLTPQRPVN